MNGQDSDVVVMTDRVYLSAPDIGQLEHEELSRVLRSGWVSTAGPDLEAFEREVADRAGVPYSVALSSGTAALHLALLSLGVGSGDIVLVPTLTFAATANAVVYTGAEPVFIDCEPETGNVDVALVGDALQLLRREGRRIGAVIPVDLFGRCVDYGRLLPVCESYDVPVVEDAAEALGASYGGQPAGSFGNAGVFSFNGNKIITTSGGGMLLTSDECLATRVRYLSTQARMPVPHYEHVDIGYNYRLSNVLAALGRAQLRRLDGMMARRRSLRKRYATLFGGLDGVTVLGDAGGDGSNCWVTVLIVDPGRTSWSAAELGGHLAEEDIETRPVWKPMHQQPVFASARRVVTGAADRLFADGLVLPSGSVLDEAKIRRVTDSIRRFLNQRSRHGDGMVETR